MDLDKLKAEIIADEGRRDKPYKDSMGIWTGGIGHNLEAHNVGWGQIKQWIAGGIPGSLIDQWFSEDLEAATECARKVFPTFDALPDNAQRVLTNMAFDLMYELLHWTDLRAKIHIKDWTGAAMAIMDSRFAKQAPARCGRLAARMVGG